MKNDTLSEKVTAFSINKAKPEERQEKFVSNLRQAICSDELRLQYQPRYNLTTGKADVLEALVRWRRPGVGLFYPEVFIPVAEENSLNFSLDFWVFERCCIDLKRLQKTVNPYLKIAVNFSALSCESLYYAQKIIEISEKHGVLLSDFKFEITQSTHVHDIRKVNSFCETLKTRGLEFSLDGFGSGQSSFSELNVLPVSAVNIDQSFVHGIGTSKRCEIIICSMLNLVTELGMQAVAVGVENSKQYWFMREAGCTQMQGFLLSKPTKLENIKLPSLIEPVIDNW